MGYGYTRAYIFLVSNICINGKNTVTINSSNRVLTHVIMIKYFVNCVSIYKDKGKQCIVKCGLI